MESSPEFTFARAASPYYQLNYFQTSRLHWLNTADTRIAIMRLLGTHIYPA